MNEYRILELRKSSYINELALLQNKQDVCNKAINEFNAEEIMDILQLLSENRYTSFKRNKYRMELIESLEQFELLDYYDALNDYAMASDKFYIKTFNPLLEILNTYYDNQIHEINAQIDIKSAAINDVETELAIVDVKIEAVSNALSNKKNNDIFYFDNGVFVFLQDEYLIDIIKISSNSRVKADLPVINLINMDSLEVSCYVEEQLIGNININDDVILYLYADNSILELGTVTFISNKAILVNGETMVEVIVSYEGDSFLPGYNIIAKIKTDNE